MAYILSSENIKNHNISFIKENCTLSGSVKITDKVRNDISLVFGNLPDSEKADEIQPDSFVNLPVISGILDNSTVIDSLIREGFINVDEIKGKREVFMITVIDNLPKSIVSEKLPGNFDSSLIIVGSDKRGLVYGLFKISEMLNVSPFVDWLDIKPSHMDSYVFDSELLIISKEPSVKFRGFFINDEWPAFGNFCNKNYGGFNAKVYEHVFELLLRLKGNYLWPAMWSAIFPNDGPGQANAELADELGVIMGASHHEPCCRQGEEYKYLRGKDSIYGDAWNFITNREGITKFWEDGLKRSGKFENVITVGMRGEADTAILGHAATLKDNIDLLRDVLNTQNSLIRKYVNEDLDSVPRMLALYKEVEPYFYGDDTTEGLIGDPQLDGVTLMLCDDNYGNLRTVPTKEMLNHKGGYGMYYHFDYHGLPISFEWFNTSYLPKVWEQMTTAYDFGIRELWIVNVGDIFTNEYPLSFFLDLAYDFDKWGTSNMNSASEYTQSFVNFNFKDKLTDDEKAETVNLLKEYTRITGARRTEAMNDNIYAPFAYNECTDLLARVESLLDRAEKLYKSLNDNVSFDFYELVYLPLTGNLNIQKMWLLTTLNHGYASYSDTKALKLIPAINKCIEKDHEIVDELHTIHNGKWYGMGMSEHIGFNYWCEEECSYPVIHSFEKTNKTRLIVSIPGTCQHTQGLSWTGRYLTLGDFLNPDVSEGTIRLSVSSCASAEYEIETDCPSLSLSSQKGIVKDGESINITVSLNREAFKYSDKTDIVILGKPFKKTDINPLIAIHSNEGYIYIRVPVNTAESLELHKYDRNTFIYCGESNVNLGSTVTAMPSYTKVNDKGAKLLRYISIEAAHFHHLKNGTDGEFRVIPEYGKSLSAIKAYPQNLDFNINTAPVATYRFTAPEDGIFKIDFYTNPSNPCTRIPELFFGISVNEDTLRKINTIPEGFAVGDGNMHWQKGVLDNIRVTSVEVELKNGLNSLDIYALSPNFVLEKIVIYPINCTPEKSYTGPSETYFIP